MNISSGTVTATNAIFAMLAISGPATASALENLVSALNFAVKPPTISSQSPLLFDAPNFTSLTTKPPQTWGGSYDRSFATESSDRKTTDIERLVGEIRSYALRDDDWDGEGGLAAIPSSLQETVNFINLLPAGINLPEAMFFHSGHSGLFWESEHFYADLKFLGSGQIAYFIEHVDEGKHKGIANFDSKKMPAVFSAFFRA